MAEERNKLKTLLVLRLPSNEDIPKPGAASFYASDARIIVGLPS